MNLNFLPNKKVRNKMYLKLFVGVFAAGVIFGFLALIYLGVVAISTGDIEKMGLSNYQLIMIAGMVIIGSILYTLFFRVFQALLGDYCY